MTQSCLDAFGRWVGTHDWNELDNHLNVNQLTDNFFVTVQSKVDEIFPIKTSKIPIKNKPWFDHKMRTLSQNKKKIFLREGRSVNYRLAVKEFNIARRTAINNYLDKQAYKASRQQVLALVGFFICFCFFEPTTDHV